MKFIEKLFPKPAKPTEPKSPGKLQSSAIKPGNPAGKRITMKPLIIIFIGGVIALIMLCITFYGKTQDIASAKVQEVKPKDEGVTVPDWFSKNEDSQKEGVVTPSSTTPALNAGNSTTGNGTPGTKLVSAQNNPQLNNASQTYNQQPQLSPYQQARLQQWQQVEQEKAQIVQDRRSALQNALTSDTTIYKNGDIGSKSQNAGSLSSEANTQHGKVAFPANTPDTDNYLGNTRVQPMSPFEVKAGTVIPSVMIGGVNSDLRGQIIAQVSQNVFDTATGSHLLIPQGTRIVGTYDHEVQTGQKRVFVIWNRLIYPNATSLNLEGMPGSDQGGYAGFSDKTNNHVWPTFRNALMLSAITAGVQLSQASPRNGDTGYSSQQIVASSLGLQMNQLGMNILGRGLNQPPTITIHPGYVFNVMVTKDMILPPWEGNS